MAIRSLTVASAVAVLLGSGAPAVAQEPESRWVISTERLNEREVVTAVLRADSSIAFASGEVTPYLIARCSDAAFHLMLDFGTPVADDVPLRFWWYDREVIDYHWSPSETYPAWARSQPTQMLDGLDKVRQFRVKFRPTGSEPLIATFTPSVTVALLSRLKSACPALRGFQSEESSAYSRRTIRDFSWDPSLSPEPPVRIGVDGPRHFPTFRVSPTYPPAALDARIEASVGVEVFIDPIGDVRDARIVNPVPLLDEAALDAVRQWKFTPTVVGGVAIPVVMRVSVDFKLP